MKKNIFKITALALLSTVFVACTEEIDESARYTLKQQTVTDYIRTNEQYTEFARLLDEVTISTHSKSNMSQLLSARGNFMVFAPTNDAIARYLETVRQKGIFEEEAKTVEEIVDKAVADSLAAVIVRNSIVDFSEYKTVFQFITDIAPTTAAEGTKSMVYSNMNNRFLKIGYVAPYEEEINGETVTIDSYAIEGAHTFKCDVQLYNGVVHEMYEVVAPSNDNVLDALAKCDEMTAFAEALSLCGLNEVLGQTEDEEYHELYWSNPSKYTPEAHPTQGRATKAFEQRLLGFTAFVETNDVYEREGLLGADGKLDLAKLKEYLASRQPAGLSQDDGPEAYKDPNNWLNYYVTYHLLPMTIEYDYLVIHYNENGYKQWEKKDDKPYTIVQTEYYTTMGKPRLLTISEGSPTMVNGTNGKRLNYFAKVVDRKNPLEMQTPIQQGILVEDPSRAERQIPTSLNGEIYPINEMLYYSPQIAHCLGTQRIRFDVSSLFPELMNNHIRRRYNEIGDYGFTKEYAFLENMIWSDESKVYYLPGYASGWHNYQGDEFNIIGVYDVYVKLPPIPASNTYELRIGVSVNPNRGMMQVYFGKDRNSLPAAGIPLDMRIGGEARYHTYANPAHDNSNVGWEIDGDDESLNDEVDKKMRLQGFMKAPAGFSKNPINNSGQLDILNSVRNNCQAYSDANGDCIRRIIVRQDMEEGEQYWIRFKSVLEGDKWQFFFDYFELVPKEVYDNPASPEDIW